MFRLRKCHNKEDLPPKTSCSLKLTKSLGIISVPGMYFLYKFNEFKRKQKENNRTCVTERELDSLNHKIVSLFFSS